MADSRIVQTHKKLQELIGVDYAAGFSGVNLSLDNVVRGRIEAPPYVPFATIAYQGTNEEYGPTLGRYQGRSIFEVFAYVGGDSYQIRSDNSINLSFDIIKAITNDRSLGLGGLIDDVICSQDSIDGDEVGLQSIGIGYVKITVSFQSDNGA